MEDMISKHLPEVVFAIGLILAAVIVVLIYMIIQHKLQKSHRDYGVVDAVSSTAVSLETSGVNILKKEMPVQEDEAVVAAIIAAICTYSGMSANEFSIRSIKVVNNNGSNWRRQSLIS